MIDDIYQKPDLRTFDQIMVDISTISNKCRLIVMTVILVLLLEFGFKESDGQPGVQGTPTATTEAHPISAKPSSQHHLIRKKGRTEEQTDKVFLEGEFQI